MKKNAYTLFDHDPDGEKQSHRPSNPLTDENPPQTNAAIDNADVVIQRSRVPSVTLYRRHNADCPHHEDRYSRDCNCMIWMYWSQNREDYRRTTGTRSWKKADRIREELEHSFDPIRAELKRLKEGAQRERVMLTDASSEFLSDIATRKKGPGTRWVLEYLLGRLSAWCESEGIHYLDEITVRLLTRWRSTWRVYKDETIRTYQAKLGKFFRFSVRQGWLGNNPVRLLEPIEGAPSRQTGYFDREEFEKLVVATDSLPDSLARPNFAIRLRTMLLLRRWSGLRLGDAVTLERSRLMGDRILLYQAKTGVPVFVPLPHDVAEALREIPAGRNPNPCYFFWDGFDKRGAVKEWMADFQKLFRLADLRTPDGKPKRCHGQMIRDTFAIELLLAGIPIEQVSALLGHSSILVTQKRYLPWVAARQQQLEASVKKAHRVPGITKCARRRDVEKEVSLFSTEVSATGSKSKKIA